MVGIMQLTVRERKEAVQFAVDNNQLEGILIGEEALAIFNRWAEGDISFQEVEDRIYELCRIR